MKRLTLEVSDELHTLIKFQSMNLKLTMSEYVREILHHEFKLQKESRGRFKNEFEIVRMKKNV